MSTYPKYEMGVAGSRLTIHNLQLNTSTKAGAKLAQWIDEGFKVEILYCAPDLRNVERNKAAVLKRASSMTATQIIVDDRGAGDRVVIYSKAKHEESERSSDAKQVPK